jgi:hypothetical protein
MRADTAEEFTAYVTASSVRLRRTAYLSSGNGDGYYGPCHISTLSNGSILIVRSGRTASGGFTMAQAVLIRPDGSGIFAENTNQTLMTPRATQRAKGISAAKTRRAQRAAAPAGPAGARRRHDVQARHRPGGSVLLLAAGRRAPDSRRRESPSRRVAPARRRLG